MSHTNVNALKLKLGRVILKKEKKKFTLKINVD